MKVAIGYGYHPTTTGTYMQHALEARAATTFVGTAWASQPGFAQTSDVSQIIADLPSTPDLYLYVDSGAKWYFPRGLNKLECPTACYLIDVHVGPKMRVKQAMFFDYVFTAQRDFVDVLRSAGHPEVHWLPLAFDPAVHKHFKVPKRFDIGFVGKTGNWYKRRTTLLMRLAEKYSINDYNQSYTAVEMSRIYSESRIVFNCSLGEEINMRLFEGLATGSLVLTDRIGNGLSDLVTNREHVVMYDDSQLLGLVEEFLHDEGLREQIARQGYEHALAHHTYDHRVSTIFDVIFGDGNPRLRAPKRCLDDSAVQAAYAEMYALGGEVDALIDQIGRIPVQWRYSIPLVRDLTLGFARRAGRTILNGRKA